MRDPEPLRNLRDGPEALAGEDLKLLRQSFEWPARRRLSVYWSLHNHVNKQRERRLRPAARRWGLAPVGGAVAAAAAAAAAAGAAAALLVALSWSSSSSSGTNPSLSTAATTLERASGRVVASPSSPDSGGAAAAWDRIEIGDLGLVEASPDAGLELRELPWARELHVRAGTLRAHIVRQASERPVVVVTPRLRVVVLGTRFDVVCGEAETCVDLHEGLVRVEAESRAVTLQAGESIGSNDARLRPLAAPADLVVRPPPDSSPEQDRRRRLPPKPTARDGVAGPAKPAPQPFGGPRTGAVRFDLRALERRSAPCLLDPESDGCAPRSVGGGDLAEQSALFAHALAAREEGRPGAAERALAALREYEERFPHGALLAEVLLRELEVLKSLGRLEEAEHIASAFARRFAADPRLPDLELARVDLLCQMPDRREEGQRLLDQLTASRASSRAPPERSELLARLKQRCGSHGDPPPLRAGKERPPGAGD